jgi:hypothetical protein
MATLSTFPSTNSIPPACFYNFQGLANWLNNNPSYKQYFIGIYPNLQEMNSTLSTIGYDITKVPLCSDVTTLSEYQGRQYNQQLSLFHRIYAYNSNAYVNYINSQTLSPIYYTFRDFQEKTEYCSSVGLVNKLYPLQAMANRVGWITPFPVYM